MRIGAIAMLFGCASASLPAASLPTNHASGAPAWSQRASELCASIGADYELGRSVLKLDRVIFGRKVHTWGSSDGHSGGSWKVTSPPELREVGLRGYRSQSPTEGGGWQADSSTKPVIETWLESDVTPLELCQALGLTLADNGCTRTDGDRVVRVTVEKGHSRLACASVKT